ncbi:MAG: hypothetical protein AAB866_02965 [Patescibacteria group bacterium]
MKKTLAPSTVVTTRDSKGRHFISTVEDAYDKAELGEEEAQRVNEAEGLADLITNFIAENRTTDKFKDEEVKSSYSYLSGYKPKGLNEQCNKLRVLFSGIGFCNQDLLAQIEKGEVELPKHAEGWFAIPNWMKNPKIFGTTYSEAVQKVLNMIKQIRNGKFENYREGQLDEKRLRQLARTQKFFRDLSESQGNPDILIVPAQFGIRHRGRSVRRAREVFLTNEFGLGAFAVGIMILTHPERLQHYDDLYIDCAGDEYDDPGSDVRFDRAPYFRFFDGKVKFGTDYVGNADDRYGSASGLVPQQ